MGSAFPVDLIYMLWRNIGQPEMKSQTTLIASPTGGMVPFDGPIDWQIHNRGVMGVRLTGPAPTNFY
jgi:hypothetical protein